jgi:hypothetical protein
LAQLQTPETKEQAPGARKLGLGAILPEGFEMANVGALTGGLLTVVVVVGATVVGVTTVVGGGVGMVVVGLEEPFEFECDAGVSVFATTRECRVLAARCTLAAMVVVVVASVVVVVVELTVVVVPIPRLAVGVMTLAIAGSAVVLRMIPATSEPIEPIITDRRGPRRDGKERP